MKHSHRLLVGIVFIGALGAACKLDRSAMQTELVATMKGAELLFFKENSSRIRLQEEIPELTFQASRRGYLEVVKYLYGLQDSSNAADDQGYTPLLYAAEAGSLPLLRFLIEQAGADVRAQNRLGVTALMLAAQNGFVEVVQYLIDRGANIDARSNQGTTVLMYAAASGNPSLVRLLLEHGLSPAVVDNSGYAAWQYALNPETAQLVR